MKALTIIGAGGHCRVVIGAARAAGWEVEAVLSDSEADWGSQIMGVQVSGLVQGLGGRSCIIAIGGNEVRKRISGAHSDAEWVAVIHPASWVDPTAVVGAGTLVCAGAVIQPEAVIGRHGIINTSSSIDHECQLADFCQVAPGAALGGRVVMGEGAFVGIGASVHQGTEIGAWAVVGGGAFAKGSIEPGVTVVGIPAKPKGNR